MEPLKRPRIVCKFNQKKLEVGDEYQCNKTIKTISSTILNPGVFTLLDLGPPPRPLLRELNDSRTSHSQDSQSLKTNAILVMDSEGERGWVDHEQFFIHDDPSPLEHLLGYDKSSKAVKKKWMTENQLVAAREEAKEGKGMFISDAALGSWDLTPHPTSTTSRQPRVRVEDRRSGQVESEIAGIPFAESSKKKVRLHAEETLDRNRNLFEGSNPVTSMRQSETTKLSIEDVERKHLRNIRSIQEQHAEQQKRMKADQARQVEKLRLIHELKVAEKHLEEAKRKMAELKEDESEESD